jgi:hypothetical protein
MPLSEAKSFAVIFAVGRKLKNAGMDRENHVGR